MKFAVGVGTSEELEPFLRPGVEVDTEATGEATAAADFLAEELDLAKKWLGELL